MRGRLGLLGPAMLLSAAFAACAPAASTAPASAALPTNEREVREQGFIPIGGIPQWITISGRNRDNPVVLILHGGPGNPLSPYSNALYGEWTEDFTIVQWDQRGAGRTFGRNPDSADEQLTIDRMARDGIEVAEHLTQRLGTPRYFWWVGRGARRSAPTWPAFVPISSMPLSALGSSLTNART